MIKKTRFQLHFGLILKLLTSTMLILFFIGCAGQQPVVWGKTGPMNMNKKAIVTVKNTCLVPPDEMDFMKQDIQERVNEVLKGIDSSEPYNIEVTITKYEEGSAFARFMLMGLGQMYLYGTVEITEGEPTVVIRDGEFKKVYSLGGIFGASATMRKNMTSKIGGAIAKAIQEVPKQ